MKALDRRTVLRGLGAAIALPLLDAMVPLRPRRALATVTGATPRLVVSYFPSGTPQDAWQANAYGTGWVPQRATAGLLPVQADVAWLGGADNANVYGIHAERLRTLLSEVGGRLPDAATYGRSFDHVATEVLAGDTAFAHLALGSEAVTSCSGPSHCDWLGAASWAGAGQPLPPDVVPASVFTRLFGSSDPLSADAWAREQRRGHSILDAVLEDATTLSGQLSAADRRRVDEHLTALREVERRLDLPRPSAESCGALEPPTPESADEHVRTMFELTRLALACDRSRVVSFMMGAGESYRGLSFLGHTIAHHSASHTDALAHEAAITWGVQRFADFVHSLALSAQADGSRLLDDTVCVFVSDISDGLTHDPSNVPLLVAGGNRVANLPLGSATALPTGTPLASVWLSLLQAFGHPTDRFGSLGTAPAADWRR
jgi:hypothetical protein